MSLKKIIAVGMYMGFCGAALLNGFGCGYTSRSMIADKYTTIYIAQFINRIDLTKETEAGNKYRINKPLLEVDISRETINRFLRDGNLHPVKTDMADLKLSGELIEFRRDPLRYDANDEVEEYRLNVIVNISLWDNRENKLLWEVKNFTGDTSYFTRGINAKTEDTALKDAVKDLGRRIVERVVEQW